MERLVALQLAGTLSAFVLLLVAVGSGRPAFSDLALGLALLSFPAGLLFAHFFERWL